MSIDIEWVDEIPAAIRRNGRRAAFVEALKTRPGTWAKYGKNGPGYLKTQLATLGLEQAQRSGVTYLRYVGK